MSDRPEDPDAPPAPAPAAARDRDDDDDLYDDDPSGTETVTVWVDPHQEADPALAVEACEAWRPEGIVCASAASSQEALIRIHAYGGACERTDDGSYVLAYAVEGGDITLIIECLRKFGGTPIDISEAPWTALPDMISPRLA